MSAIPRDAWITALFHSVSWKNRVLMPASTWIEVTSIAPVGARPNSSVRCSQHRLFVRRHDGRDVDRRLVVAKFGHGDRTPFLCCRAGTKRPRGSPPRGLSLLPNAVSRQRRSSHVANGISSSKSSVIGVRAIWPPPPPFFGAGAASNASPSSPGSRDARRGLRQASMRLVGAGHVLRTADPADDLERRSVVGR